MHCLCESDYIGVYTLLLFCEYHWFFFFFFFFFFFQSSYFICYHLQYIYIYIHTIADLTNMVLNFLVMYSLTSFLPSFVNYIRLCLNILSIPYVS